MKQLAAIVIPVYKQQPDQIEQFCLAQCTKVLNKYTAIFVFPEGMDVTYYKNAVDGKVNSQFIEFEKEYFSGIPGYNKLMLSKDFYNKFTDYEYILIHQLDAFVFKDELEYWCKKGYYYIGAPYIFFDLDTYPIKFLTKYRALLKFLEKIKLPIYTYRHVGNGGFSLRHVNKSLQLLTICNKSAKNWTALMEDNFFMYWGNLLFLYFNLAKEKDAVRFSIETDVKRSFEFAGSQLPFGCHAFMRYEPEFWAPYFKELGYDIST